MNLSDITEQALKNPTYWRNTHYDTEEVDSKIENLVSNQLEITPKNISNVIGRSWKSTLKKMIPFLNRMYNSFPFNWKQEWAPIPQANWANKLNVRQQTIGIWIKHLKKLYILETIGEHNFISKTTMIKCMRGHSQDYLCNKPQLKKLLEYAKSDLSSEYMAHDKNHIPNMVDIGNTNKVDGEENVVVWNVKDNNNNNDSNVSNGEMNSDIYNDVVINSNNERRNVMLLLINYMNSGRASDNQNLPPLEQYHFMNGNRRYADICSVKSLKKAMKTGKIDENDKKQVSEFYETSREKHLDSVFGRGGWKEYDRTASVPTITYLFNKGEWKNNGYDFYGEFARALRGDGYTEQDRKDIKNLFMICYFSNLRGMWQIFRQSVNALWHKLPVKYEHLEMLAAMIRLSDEIKEDVTVHNIGDIWRKYIAPTMKELNQKIIDILGKGFGPDIFILESAVYTEVKRNIPERNVQVYDAFYLSKSSKIDMDLIMEEAAYKILAKIKSGDLIS